MCFLSHSDQPSLSQTPPLSYNLKHTCFLSHLLPLTHIAFLLVSFSLMKQNILVNIHALVYFFYVFSVFLTFLPCCHPMDFSFSHFTYVFFSLLSPNSPSFWDVLSFSLIGFSSFSNMFLLLPFSSFTCTFTLVLSCSCALPYYLLLSLSHVSPFSLFPFHLSHSLSPNPCPSYPLCFAWFSVFNCLVPPPPCTSLSNCLCLWLTCYSITENFPLSYACSRTHACGFLFVLCSLFNSQLLTSSLSCLLSPEPSICLRHFFPLFWMCFAILLDILFHSLVSFPSCLCFSSLSCFPHLPDALTLTTTPSSMLIFSLFLTFSLSCIFSLLSSMHIFQLAHLYLCFWSLSCFPLSCCTSPWHTFPLHHFIS